MGDPLGHRVPVPDRGFRVNCRNQVDQHAVAVPAHPHVGDPFDSGDAGGNLGGPVDQFRINCIEEPAEHPGRRVAQQHQDHGCNDQPGNRVDPVGAECRPDSGSDHRQ